MARMGLIPSWAANLSWGEGETGRGVTQLPALRSLEGRATNLLTWVWGAETKGVLNIQFPGVSWLAPGLESAGRVPLSADSEPLSALRAGDACGLPRGAERRFPDGSSPLRFSYLGRGPRSGRALPADPAKERARAPGAAWPTGSQSASCRSLILLKPVLSSFPSAVKTARSGRAPL